MMCHLEPGTGPCYVSLGTHRATDVGFVMFQCWASVVDGGPTLTQHRQLCINNIIGNIALLRNMHLYTSVYIIVHKCVHNSQQRSVQISFAFFMQIYFFHCAW